MDPLAQLKDIHIPEAINNYPLAYGWWILLMITIVLIALAIHAVIRHRKVTKFQREAIKRLSLPIENNDEIIITLKWAAIQYFPRQTIAQFHGEQLIEFFLKHLPEKHHEKFKKLSQNGFDHRYHPSESSLDNDLLQAALLWLKHALPTKNNAKAEVSHD
ncbi:DUF4381 domain-containing protein [Thalassotalea profundi]|uniref:Membrane protein n=1 Tax=Thalassotalea profundi TaxID=2036687 RepID=A0ABQ3IE81_9GAMM|nr:DUF4381 domain-containing protein [Thalassotalea profundi]GHE80350.1 membrane protein [Thalassotalea profundi]